MSAPRGEGEGGRGVLVGGGGLILACTEVDPPVDRQTPVKILPWPNFVAAGKYKSRKNLDQRHVPVK